MKFTTLFYCANTFETLPKEKRADTLGFFGKVSLILAQFKKVVNVKKFLIDILFIQFC